MASLARARPFRGEYNSSLSAPQSQADSGTGTGDRSSISRAELQIAITVDGLDADLVLLAVPLHGQLDGDPGGAAAPQHAIEFRKIVDCRPVDRNHPVAVPEPRSFGRTLRCDPPHHEFSVEILEAGAEPRARRGRAPQRDQVSHYRAEPVDRDEHIAGNPA